MTNGYEILVVLLIIAFTLYVGIMASKGVTDIRSFAISRDYFGSFAITCTIVASFIGGASIIGTAEKSFHQGLAPVSAWLGFCLQLILTATVIVPRLDKFIDTISVGDIIQTAYGRKAKILTGVIWVLFCTGIIVAQTKALGSIIGIFSSLGADINSIIGLCIVISYCYLGGIRSVVATDILQFIVMFIALPIMLIFAMNHIGGFSGILERVPKDYFEISGSISAGEVAFLFLGFAFGDALIPPMIQRLIMASHSKKAKRSIFIASVLIIPLYAIGGLLGMIAFALNPELHHSDIMPYLFRTVLTPGITGLAVAGLMAAIMSSADSYLNSASIALVHDVIKPLSRGAISKEYELKLARATTVLIGFAAIFLTLLFDNILDVITNTFKLWGPTIMAPLAFVIFNKRIPIWGFYTSAIVGFSTVILFETMLKINPDLLRLANNLHLDGLIPGIAANIASCIFIYKLCHIKDGDVTVIESI